tara:strand:+ start:1584 stop:2408 length:825 start_codon:yes stop_codon:yes gene_type:complete
MELAFINDEVGPALDDALRFADRHEIRLIEMRSVDEVNLAQMPLAEVEAIADRLKAAGLRVVCLASPLLKWVPEGRRSIGDEANQHGFVRGDQADAELFRHVFAVADVLGAPMIRVFAYLRYAGFEPDDLAEDYAALFDLAAEHGKTLVLENEPPSNAGDFDEMMAVLDHWQGPRFGALLDIANVYEAGGTPLDAEARARIAPFVRHIHCKDFDAATGRRMPVGQGSVPFANVLPPLLDALGQQPVTLSLETHVAEAPAAATAESLSYLRHLLA